MLASLPHHDLAAISGHSFFPHLIAVPFSTGLHEAFAFAIVACGLAAFASARRGGRYVAEVAPAGSGSKPASSRAA